MITLPIYTEMRRSRATIANYVTDGWSKVCNVQCEIDSDNWHYANIDRSIMYSNHTSWVYAITINGIIAKIGETGNPLGIRNNKLEMYKEAQPIANSKSRLGRYRSGDTTDARIRSTLNKVISSGALVEFWAMKCDTITSVVNVLGKQITTVSTTHKQLEKDLLDQFNKITGQYPLLNIGRA